MPPRRAVDDPAAELERLRELSRQRVKRYRERRNASGNATEAPQGVPGNVTPPHTPPVCSSSKEEEQKIRRLLEPFAERGYVHSERFWELAASEYPALNLELEALKIADWLLTPKNAKRRCPKTFLDNWLKKAEQDRKQRELAPMPAPATRGAPGRPPDPEPVLPADVTLVPIDLTDYHRAIGEARKVPLKERLAGASNGVHK